MLSIARSRRLIIPAHILFLATNGLGIFLSIIYDAKTPDLYPNNSHHKMGWAITWIAVAWAAMSIIVVFTRPSHSGYQPISDQAMAEHHRLHADTPQSPNFRDYRWSRDSGQGTEPNTASLASSSRSNSWNETDDNFPIRKHYRDDSQATSAPDWEQDHADEKQSFLGGATRTDRFFSNKIAKLSLGSRALKIINVLQTMIERTVLVLGFVAITTGLVAYGGTARGHHIFNTLAHLIKGGIFFVYGFLTFGRWLGCFADFGWAWNIKPGAEVVGKRKARMPSAEATESFVIFLYGASNVFLEHLTAWGKAWSAMDLEHISITIMFFGGGLLGMLIESDALRRLMTVSLSPPALTLPRTSERWAEPKQTTSHPLNPMPALVIFLLGLMMSSHTQHSPVSAAIHKQWGLLFSGFSLSRVLTYLTMYLKPPTSYVASRPPTEVIASFCLVAGGVIFMASNADTVHALEAYELDAMFVFTVVMGLASLLLAWTVLVIAVKNWAVQREQRRLGDAPGPVEISAA